MSFTSLVPSLQQHQHPAKPSVASSFSSSSLNSTPHRPLLIKPLSSAPAMPSPLPHHQLLIQAQDLRSQLSSYEMTRGGTDLDPGGAVASSSRTSSFAPISPSSPTNAAQSSSAASMGARNGVSPPLKVKLSLKPGPSISEEPDAKRVRISAVGNAVVRPIKLEVPFPSPPPAEVSTRKSRSPLKKSPPLDIPDSKPERSATSAIRQNRSLRREFYASSEEILRCRDIVCQLLRIQSAQPFIKPVDPVVLNLPDYFDIIKQPMDLEQIYRRLQTGEYEKAQDVLNDVTLVWQNCRRYNGPEHLFSKWANELDLQFTPKLQAIVDRFSPEMVAKRKEERENKKLLRQIAMAEAQLHQMKSNPTKFIETLPMTLEEKYKLRQRIHALDTISLAKVYRAVQSTCPDILVDDGTGHLYIELEDISPKSTRELERLVALVIERKRRKRRQYRKNQQQQHLAGLKGEGEGLQSGDDDEGSEYDGKENASEGEDATAQSGGVRGKRKRGADKRQPRPAAAAMGQHAIRNGKARSRQTVDPSMPMGFEELPSDAAFGIPDGHEFGDSEDDQSVTPEPGAEQSQAPAETRVMFHPAALAAGLDFDLDDSDEDDV